MRNLAVMTVIFLTQSCRTAGTSPDLTMVGGTHAAPGQFPSVLIWTPSGHNLATSYCTGAKVADRFILTAAHCVLEQAPEAGRDYIGPWHKIKSLADAKSMHMSQSLVMDDTAERSTLVITHVHWHPHVERCLTDESWRSHKDCTWRTPLPDAAVIEVEPTPEFAKIPAADFSLDVVTAELAITMLGYGAQGEDDKKPPQLRFHETTVATDKDLEAALAGTEAERDGPPKLNQFFGALGVLAGQEHANLGSGDSGGPVMRRLDGRIIGVNSDGFCPLTAPRCERTSNSFFARLDDTSPYHVGRWLSTILGRGLP